MKQNWYFSFFFWKNRSKTGTDIFVLIRWPCSSKGGKCAGIGELGEPTCRRKTSLSVYHNLTLNMKKSGQQYGCLFGP